VFFLINMVLNGWVMQTGCLKYISVEYQDPT